MLPDVAWIKKKENLIKTGFRETKGSYIRERKERKKERDFGKKDREKIREEDHETRDKRKSYT